jgi:hypothetical protein
VLCAGLSQAADLKGGLAAFAGAYQGTTSFKDSSPPDPDIIGNGPAFGIFTGLKTLSAGRLSLACILDEGDDSLPVQVQIKFRSSGTFAYALLTGAEPITGTGTFTKSARVIHYKGTVASSMTRYALTGRILRFGRLILVQEKLFFDGGSLFLSTRLKPLSFPVSGTKWLRLDRAGAGSN